jgi:hypothetical protein
MKKYLLATSILAGLGFVLRQPTIRISLGGQT